MTRTAALFATLVLLACADGRAKTAAAGVPDSPPADAAAAARVKPGTWGGEHVRLEVVAGGATIEYDCAHGMIDEPLSLDAQGRFSARGRHVLERGGPVRREEPPARAARYIGRVTGDRMQLTVTIDGEQEALGTFALVHGADPVLTKCR